MDPQGKLESTDIEGYLAHHHDIIILGAIEDARRASEEAAAELERRYDKRVHDPLSKIMLLKWQLDL